MFPTSTFTLFFIALFAVFSLVASAPAPLLQRDVYSPPVLYPRNGTVWRVGEHHNVTWDISNAPEHITNNIGMVILCRDHELLDLDRPLAKNFNILIARHEIVVPDVEPGNNYRILVFGDSGNTGEMFTITK
ncbi:hypothetical protein B0H17DRAFT_1207028 [Mycena rosella]|uniref:Uncharacterized protein n=1 Tax=Mycena rosella TaxID=1033263 RepID=A0AAD7GCU6_MYCRO|nr:hypothetical protein B0H17DRAFT_1207028 [Mycena rosella]